MFKLPKQIKEGIADYEVAIGEFREGKIPWARLTGIRVPWGNYSHRGGKVFMSRVRIPAGVLTPSQLKALAYCAKNYGNGILHLTTRQDIQIHEVKIENIIQIHEYLKDYELSSRGGGGNTVRNITACPLTGICAKEIFDVRQDAVALTEYLLSQETSYNLPRKFKIGFSGCGLDCAGCLVNDVGLFATKLDTKIGYRVYAGGGMGAKSALGRLLEEFISREDLGYVVSAIKNVFYKYGDRRNKHHNRLRFLIEDIGFTKLKEYYQKELKSLKETEFISLRKVSFSYPQTKKESLAKTKDLDFEYFLKYSCLTQKQKGSVLVKLRIPRGDLEANTAEDIADLEKEFKGIEFRTSQEQNLYAANIPQKDLSEFYSRIKDILADFLYPQTLLDVVACKGSLTCNLGLCNSPGLAEQIENLIKKEFLGTKVFAKLNLKINGCPNACGQHPIGIISLHGVVRKVSGRIVPFYRLLLGGRVGLEESCLTKDTEILIPAKNVSLFLKDFLKKIETEINEDTDIHKYIVERGPGLAQQIYTDYAYVPAYSENKDFYIDWGRKEEFSLEGLGPGECGAGVLDMIESDLMEAKIALEKAQSGKITEEIKKALFLSSRALLVVRGADPKNESEAFANFKTKFIAEGISADTYSQIEEVFKGVTEDLSQEEKKEKFLYAQQFLEHINQLYKSMDSSFNFPKSKEESKVTVACKSFLDLKGTPCPLNYVKTKLFLENLNLGDILEVLLDEGEPMDNVPKSLESDGHQILKIEKLDGFYKVVIKKGS